MPELATPAEAGGLEAFRRGQAVLKTMRRIRLGLTLLLFAIILGFLFAFYSHASTAWQPEQFEPHAVAELKRLQPTLGKAAGSVLADVRPKYELLARQKFAKVKPELEKTASEEMVALFKDADVFVQAELRTVVRSAYARQMEAVKDEFPRFGDEHGQSVLQARLEKGLEQDVDRIVAKVQRRYMKEVQAVQDELMLFRPNRFERMSEDQMGRYFIHLWVQLLDLHLLENMGGAADVR